MSGAYTAKPVVIPPVQYPPPWNPIWPWPGPPFPPGFNAGIRMTADATISPGSATQHVSLTLADWGNAGPPSGSPTLTATLNGNPLRLGYSLGTLADSVPTGYESTPSLYFEIGPSDSGKTITLMAEGTPYPAFGPLGGAADIAVISSSSKKLVYTLTITSIDAGGTYADASVIVNIDPEGSFPSILSDGAVGGQMDGNESFDTHLAISNGGGVVTFSGNTSVTATYTSFLQQNYALSILLDAPTGSITVTVMVTYYVNDVVQGTHSHSFSISGDSLYVAYATFDSATGTITVL